MLNYINFRTFCVNVVAIADHATTYIKDVLLYWFSSQNLGRHRWITELRKKDNRSLQGSQSICIVVYNMEDYTKQIFLSWLYAPSKTKLKIAFVKSKST